MIWYDKLCYKQAIGQPGAGRAPIWDASRDRAGLGPLK